MTRQIAIYLAGNIQKGHEKESRLVWTQDDIEALRAGCPGIEITFLNPASRSDDLSDQKSVFGRDMTQVALSDFVFVDARERRGLGVGAEMMFAKMRGTPVISWASKDTHYQKSSLTYLEQTIENWVHPFVESLSDAVVSDMREAATAITSILSGEIAVKDATFIEEAMRHYQSTQLPNDQPMLDLLKEATFLKL